MFIFTLQIWMHNGIKIQSLEYLLLIYTLRLGRRILKFTFLWYEVVSLSSVYPDIEYSHIGAYVYYKHKTMCI